MSNLPLLVRAVCLLGFGVLGCTSAGYAPVAAPPDPMRLSMRQPAFQVEHAEVAPRRRVRLPAFLQATRPVRSAHGIVIPAQAIDPDAVYRLRNGRRVTAQEYLDVLDKVEREQPGTLAQLRASPRERVLSPRSRAVMAMNDGALRRRLSPRAQAQNGAMPRGTLRHRVMGPPFGVQPRLGPPSRPGHFEQAWPYGDPDWVAVGMRLSVDNTASADGAVHCEARLALDATVLNHTWPSVAVATVSGESTGNGRTSGTFDLRVADRQVAHATGVATIDRAIPVESPRAAITVPVAGPITLKLEAWLDGGLSLRGRLVAPPPPQTGCAFELTPSAKLVAHANASPRVAGLFGSLLAAFIDVGVRAELTVADVSVRLQDALTVVDGRRLTLREQLSGDLDATFLYGRIYAYLDLPDLFDLFGGSPHEFEIVSWPGVTVAEPIFELPPREFLLAMNGFPGATPWSAATGTELPLALLELPSPSELDSAW